MLFSILSLDGLYHITLFINDLMQNTLIYTENGLSAKFLNNKNIIINRIFCYISAYFSYTSYFYYLPHTKYL